MSIGNLSRVVNAVNIPGIVTPVFQSTPFAEMLSDMPRLGDISSPMAYMTSITNTSSNASISNGWAPAVDRADFTVGQLSSLFYAINSKVDYTEEDEKGFSKLTGQSLIETLRYISEQGVNNRAHILCSYGSEDGYQQGIATQATKTNLPADSTGATTVVTYNPVEMVKFLTKTINEIRNLTYDASMPTVIFAPINFVSYIETELVDFLNSANAGGLTSIIGTMNLAQMLANKKTLVIHADDTLKGRGAGGKDAFLLVAPRITNRDKAGRFNQNLLAEGTNNALHNTLMIASVLDQIDVNPKVNRVYSETHLTKLTSGWLIRKDTAILCTYTYE